MADFKPEFARTLRNEGGLRLETVAGDRGGQTFGGISRANWPTWSGWPKIDAGDRGSPELQGLVEAFYRNNFWTQVRGDDLADQRVAGSLYDFAVNAGASSAVKVAQAALGVPADGVLGPQTLAALNAARWDDFRLRFALAKVRRYAQICNADRTQERFLLGWLNRTLSDLERKEPA